MSYNIIKNHICILQEHIEKCKKLVDKNTQSIYTHKTLNLKVGNLLVYNANDLHVAYYQVGYILYVSTETIRLQWTTSNQTSEISTYPMRDVINWLTSRAYRIIR